MLKQLFISIIFICSISCLSAQNTNSVGIDVYSDQQVYVAGEMIWINGKLDRTVSSKFIDISLIDRNGNEKTIVSLLNRDGLFSGYIEVPKEIKSDFYFLDCSIKGMSTTSEVRPIMIIHPAYPASACQTTDQLPIGTPSIAPGNMLISNKKNYPIRGEISFSVAGLRELNNISIDVVRDDLLTAYADSIISKYNMKASHPAKGDIESEGHQVVARVLSVETGLPVKGVGVYASIMGHQASLSYGTSNSVGEIKFLFAPVLNETRIVFSVPEKDAKRLKVEMVDDAIVHEPINFPCLSLREEMRFDIEERLLSVNVMKQFDLNDVKQGNGIEYDTTDFYGKPDARYLLDNYVRFPDMKEILFEFVPEVRVKKAVNDSGVIVEILNDPYKRYFTESAMVMLDGVPIQNVNELLEFDPLKLKSIDVISRLFYLGGNYLNGIINYKSYTKDLAGFTLTPAEVIYPFRGAQGYPVPRFFKHQALKKNGLPDFRNLLYRETIINNNSNESLPFAFSASDSKGNFKIIIRGFNKSGKSLMSSSTFSVQ
jgi:hypothetical protein